jgi:mutator protein MutT
MREIDVAAALLFRDGKLLITQRHPEAHLGGLWEFPGGKREPGETFENCLVREIKEELGMEIAVGELVSAVTHGYPEKTVHLKFFRCRWVRHEPEALDCAAFQWVTKEKLRTFQFPEADTQLISKLLTERELWLE